jgi:hypothetical protein
MGPRRVAIAASLAVLAACGKSEIEGTRVCRRFASMLTENGRPAECTFDVRFLRCAGATRTVWEYPGPEAFVLEPQVPNRIAALGRSVSSGGPMLVSFSETRTTYRYDGSGRLVERVREGSNVTGTRELDAVEYTAWDAEGRPTAGTIRAEGRRGPVTLRYDDAARRMDASSGESVTRDVNGNIVREVLVFGFGAPFTVEDVIQATTEFCL